MIFIEQKKYFQTVLLGLFFCGDLMDLDTFAVRVQTAVQQRDLLYLGFHGKLKSTWSFTQKGR